jgi:hypothetical protein
MQVIVNPNTISTQNMAMVNFHILGCEMRTFEHHIRIQPNKQKLEVPVTSVD